MMFLRQHYRPIVGTAIGATAGVIAAALYYTVMNSGPHNLPGWEKIAEEFQCCVGDYCDHKGYGNKTTCYYGSDDWGNYELNFWCLDKLDAATFKLLCTTAFAYVATPTDWALVAGIAVGCGAVGAALGYAGGLRQQMRVEYKSIANDEVAAGSTAQQSTNLSVARV